jgi:general secretion pathway protein H
MEVLLVLVLLAGSSVAVLMTFPDRKADVLADSAKGFYQRLRLLSEEAMLNGVDLGVRISDHEYQFFALKGREWQEMGETGLFKPVEENAEFTRLFLSLGSAAWEDKDRLFEPSSLFEPSRFDDEEKKIDPPQIWVMSSGEITPFTLRFEPNASIDDSVWRVVVTESSDLKLLSPSEVFQP